MEIRRTAAWMQQVDDRILEFVRDEGWVTPKILAARPEFQHVSQARLRERCRWLVYAGLLAPISGDMVDLTSAGARYLDGDLDASNQPRPRPGVPEALA